MGVVMTTLAAAFALVPATGGLPITAAAPIAATTGLSVVAIMSIFFLGITSVVLVADKYNFKIKAKGKIDGAEGEIILEKKQS